MRYRGFEITACPDNGVERYNSAESRDELYNGFFCEIYPANDSQHGNRLDTFCLAEGYEIPDTSEESLADGIIQYVDENYYALLESKNEVKQKRTEELVGRLVCWLGENESGAELYDTLSQVIGMTDDEIREVGFSSLAPFFDREQYAQTIADWLIDNGTENSFSGSWIVHHEEIAERFGVNLKTDEELRNMVSRHLYDSSDIVADFCMDADKVDLDFYLAYCPYYNQNEAENESMEYILFAIKEPKLFQLLFMSEQPQKPPVAGILPIIDESYEQILQSVQSGYGLGMKDAENLYRHLWIYTHGIAVLCATNMCSFTAEETSGMMTEVFRSLLKEIKGDKAK